PSRTPTPEPPPTAGGPEESVTATPIVTASPPAPGISEQQESPPPGESGTPSVQLLLEQAREHLGRGEAEQARKLYRMVASLQPDSGEAWAGVASSSAQLGEWEVAFVSYRKALTCPDARPEWETARADIGRRVAGESLKRAQGLIATKSYADAEA